MTNNTTIMANKTMIKLLSFVVTSLKANFSPSSLFLLSQALEENNHSFVSKLLVDVGVDKSKFDNRLFFGLFEVFRTDGTHENDWLVPQRVCEYLLSSSELKATISLSDSLTLSRFSYFIFYRCENLAAPFQIMLARFVYGHANKGAVVNSIGSGRSKEDTPCFAPAKDIFMLSVKDRTVLEIFDPSSTIRALNKANPDPKTGILSPSNYEDLKEVPVFYNLLALCNPNGGVRELLKLLLGEDYSANRVFQTIKDEFIYTPKTIEREALLEYAGFLEVSPVHRNHLSRCFNLRSCILTTIGILKLKLRDEFSLLELRHPENGSYVIARLILNLVNVHLDRGVSKDEIIEELESIIDLPFVNEYFLESIANANFNSLISKEALNLVLDQIPERLKEKTIMNEPVTIKEVEEAEKKLQSGKAVITVFDTMSNEHIGKVIGKKLRRASGVPITVVMTEGVEG